MPSKAPTLREQLESFFSRPLLVFGRQYSPFCAKDGAVIYFAEKGLGIEPKDERTLAQFAQAVRSFHCTWNGFNLTEIFARHSTWM